MNWQPIETVVTHFDKSLVGVTDATDGKFTKVADGCWLWSGTVRRDGYPVVRFKYRQWRAHRLHFAFYKGPLVAGLEIDHTCNNRRCVNPDHLEQVTGAENMLRAVERREVCRRGHVRAQGSLTREGACRDCRREAKARRRAGGKAHAS